MKKFLTFLALALVPSLAFAGAAITVDSVLSIIVYLVIVGLILWVISWFVAYVGVPEPFNRVIRVVLGLVALIIVIDVLLSFIGHGIIWPR